MSGGGLGFLDSPTERRHGCSDEASEGNMNIADFKTVPCICKVDLMVVCVCVCEWRTWGFDSPRVYDREVPCLVSFTAIYKLEEEEDK